MVMLPLNLNHQLIRNHKVKAVVRFLSWQLKSRMLKRDFVHYWVSGSKFFVRNGETGLTQNIYVGLHEFDDMCFLMHSLRKNDLFIDVGANSGSYSILAGSVCEARVISIEPIRKTFLRLVRNLSLNNLEQRCTPLNVGLDAENGTLIMTTDLDTKNQIVIGESFVKSSQIKVITLDEAVQDQNPVLIKVDVEGWEMKVLQGGLKTLLNPSLLALIVELNESGTRYGYRDSEIVETLRSFNFLPFSYDAMKRELNPIAGKNTKGGNTIFIRDLERIVGIIESARKREVLGTWV